MFMSDISNPSLKKYKKLQFKFSEILSSRRPHVLRWNIHKQRSINNCYHLQHYVNKDVNKTEEARVTPPVIDKYFEILQHFKRK